VAFPTVVGVPRKKEKNNASASAGGGGGGGGSSSSSRPGDTAGLVIGDFAQAGRQSSDLTCAIINGALWIGDAASGLHALTPGLDESRAL